MTSGHDHPITQNLIKVLGRQDIPLPLSFTSALYLTPSNLENPGLTILECPYNPILPTLSLGDPRMVMEGSKAFSKRGGKKVWPIEERRTIRDFSLGFV